MKNKRLTREKPGRVYLDDERLDLPVGDEDVVERDLARLDRPDERAGVELRGRWHPRGDLLLPERVGGLRLRDPDGRKFGIS